MSMATMNKPTMKVSTDSAASLHGA